MPQSEDEHTTTVAATTAATTAATAASGADSDSTAAADVGKAAEMHTQAPAFTVADDPTIGSTSGAQREVAEPPGEM